MPKITISAQLIRITRSVHPGQWLLIHEGEDRYEVLDHARAMALQGKRQVTPRPAKSTPVIPTAPTAPTTPATRRTMHAMHIPRPASSIAVQVNGKTIRVEPQKMAVLQYMGTHGDLTVEQAGALLDNPKTSILSALKALGFVTSRPTETDRFSPHIYSLTNEGRAIAKGAIPAAE